MSSKGEFEAMVYHVDKIPQVVRERAQMDPNSKTLSLLAVAQMSKELGEQVQDVRSRIQFDPMLSLGERKDMEPLLPKHVNLFVIITVTSPQSPLKSLQLI